MTGGHDYDENRMKNIERRQREYIYGRKNIGNVVKQRATRGIKIQYKTGKAR